DEVDAADGEGLVNRTEGIVAGDGERMVGNELAVIEQGGFAAGAVAVAVVGAEVVVVPLIEQRHAGEQGAQTGFGQVRVKGGAKGFHAVLGDVVVVKIAGVQKEAGALFGRGVEDRRVHAAGAGADGKAK